MPSLVRHRAYPPAFLLVPLVFAGCGPGIALPTDPDGDGIPGELGDCNNQDASVYPGAEERCDAQDNDCDGTTDEGFSTAYFRDADRDGFGDAAEPVTTCASAAGLSVNAQDCNDTEASINPTAEEICDGKDNNCNAQSDEDADGDTWLPCPASAVGTTEKGGDCDNLRPDIHPETPEIWGDGLDQDCDGTIDADRYVSTDGTSPEPQKPLTASIQEAIVAAAPGDVIAIAPGEYRESLELLGQDITLIGMGDASAIVVNAQGVGSGLLVRRGETVASRISNLTFTGGVGTDAAFCGTGISGSGPNGGGICIQSSSPTLTNLIITGNTARDGGGIHVSAGSPTFHTLRIAHNDASGDGGGIYLYAAAPSATDLLVTGNSATQNGGGMLLFTSAPHTATHWNISGNSAQNGGGLALRVDSDGTFSHLLIQNNTATNDAGGIWVDDSAPFIEQCIVEGNQVTGAPGRGGGMYSAGAAPTLEHCLIQSNQATYGGGMSLNWDSVPVLSQLVVMGNQASEQGGGIFYYGSSGTLDWSVIAGNRSEGSGGGLFFYSGAEPVLTSVILSENVNANGPSNLQASTNLGAEPLIFYSLLWSANGTPGASGATVANSATVNPLFMGSPGTEGWKDVDVRLQGTSQGVNAGDPAELDPDGSRADIGAYGGPGASRWDLDGDGIPQQWAPGEPADPCIWDANDRDVAVFHTCTGP